MKRVIPASLIVTVVGIYPTHALDFGSIAEECIRSNGTFSCGSAFTQISSSEANLFTAIEVAAQFNSPGESFSGNASRNIVSWNPLTWSIAIVKTAVYCAWAGHHETVGNHVFQFPGQPLQYSSSSSFFRAYCDCGGDPQ